MISSKNAREAAARWWSVDNGKRVAVHVFARPVAIRNDARQVDIGYIAPRGFFVIVSLYFKDDDIPVHVRDRRLTFDRWPVEMPKENA